MKRSITRRDFFRTNLVAALAAPAFPMIAPSSVFGAEAPSKRINVGCIGTGPQGRGDMGGFLGQSDARVVAVCDVKKDQLELARRQVNERYQNQDCATHIDFRDLLARKDIDAVLIATPDHWHVPIAVAAAKAGKDIYLEKPMGLTLAEDRLLRKTVLEEKRVFQFGTQQRSSREFLQACELVRNGRIGKLKQINVWSPASRPGGSVLPAPVPEGLDYDRWLGPARFTPYTEDKCAADNKTWWFNDDYALGFIAGWGVHPLDIALWGHPAMFKSPMEVEGKAIFPNEGACNTSVAWDVNFTFADGVTMAFRGTPNGYPETNALNDFTEWRNRYGKIDGHGTAFEGTDGWVLVSRGSLRTSPEALPQDPIEPKRVPLMKSRSHVRNFLDSVKTRGATICPIDEAVKADTLCHLSNIATRMNRKLKWDPVKEQFIGDAEANKRLELRPMRKPWQFAMK
jgi:predicted dehydrogenase